MGDKSWYMQLASTSSGPARTTTLRSSRRQVTVQVARVEGKTVTLVSEGKTYTLVEGDDIDVTLDAPV